MAAAQGEATQVRQLSAQIIMTRMTRENSKNPGGVQPAHLPMMMTVEKEMRPARKRCDVCRPNEVRFGTKRVACERVQGASDAPLRQLVRSFRDHHLPLLSISKAFHWSHPICAYLLYFDYTTSFSARVQLVYFEFASCASPQPCLHVRTRRLLHRRCHLMRRLSKSK